MVRDFNYRTELRSRRVGPKKWMISIPIVLSERFKAQNYLMDTQDTRTDDVYKVKESALNYVATERIKNLAQPKLRDNTIKESDSIVSTTSRVKISALSYMPTKRIIQLARPKDPVHECTFLQ
ncbi:unnamed protein product [Psylliodes chrysocephalus]|uniref:Uncharacterized protein n=1 Tax=Psylliodes chrysocephalus TaxID=3402493 RepID=A0A9P0G7Y6_9CUCU|nr:unnamed protein product [Psylliodes chrysocephala]